MLKTQRLSITAMLLSFVVIVSCDFYEWDPEIKTMTNRNLKEWLKTAPLNNLWDIRGDDNNVITNLNEVFPHYEGFIDSSAIKLPYKAYYDDAVLTIKDSLGEGYIYSALLNAKQNVFLKESYSKRGNVVFSGMEAHNDLHRSTLKTIHSETNATYSSAIYNVVINHNYKGKNYVLCHYQKGAFLFQLMFVNPLKYNEKSKRFEYNYTAAVDRIQKVTKTLKLNIPEWKNLSVSDLEP